MMCSSAKLGAKYLNTLQSGQTHIKAEITADLEEIVTDHPEKLHHDLICLQEAKKYYVPDGGDKPENSPKITSRILSDSLSPQIKDETTNDDDGTHDDNSGPLTSTIPTESLLSCSSTAPLDGKQLLFLYDCETTGLSHYTEHIIEIGSVVIVPDNLSVTQTEFSSLCHTSHPICLDAFDKHGITAGMLVGQPSFSIVFRGFLEWIKQCTKEACSNNSLYYPVLVAHHGFPFHYYFLMAEIKHHNLEQSLIAADLWFADTLYDARRLLKASDPISNNWSQHEPKILGLVPLFHKFFPEEPFGDPRRAMEDIQAMNRVFTTTALTPILKNLTIKTKEEIWRKWYEKWNARRISKPYIAKMGNYCSERLAVCLHNKGITYDQLQEAFVTHSSEEYDEWMKGVGIRLKIWRNKIQNHFSDH